MCCSVYMCALYSVHMRNAYNCVSIVHMSVYWTHQLTFYTSIYVLCANVTYKCINSINIRGHNSKIHVYQYFFLIAWVYTVLRSNLFPVSPKFYIHPFLFTPCFFKLAKPAKKAKILYKENTYLMAKKFWVTEP